MRPWLAVFFMFHREHKEAVLLAGCGHGLLGIWALKSGASAVVFQDLNKDVLNLATRWNILKNTENDRVGVALQQQHELSVPIHAAVPSPSAAELGATGAASASVDVMGNPTQDEGNAQKKGGGSFTLLHGRALCVAASWEEYPKICCSCQCARTKAPAEMKASENTKTNSEEQIEMVAESNGLTAPAATPDSATETLRQSKAREIQYSLIFCSEGTYREETFEPLAEIFKRLLHKDGIALIASKRYYFGIGGGSLAFISFLREKYADSLSVEVAASYRGVNSNNFRDVLLIRNKGKPEE
ncbi:LOW QUALITY PROTEIN: uncharacterized protein EMH_0021600 [Eimeria mitis]|uniref:protein-histidine N-methyltransferase n=1 Tax=Eimeria mitis TaxID=44415 RepID=U6K9Q6_9EIME|nr:LOW QUALITY PROTEIN: uncharacterized protein EMH_0021600 [Eimeria mitis]CDJ34694.1 hypothetical protein, conserved [Eimeria mitis]